MYDIFKFWNLLLLAIEKMSLHLQSNVIWKRIKLETSAWSSFVEFLKFFKKLIDSNYEIFMVFDLQSKNEVFGFFSGHGYTYYLGNKYADTCYQS